jgi:hypothetical protein
LHFFLRLANSSLQESNDKDNNYHFPQHSCLVADKPNLLTNIISDK